MKATKTSGWVGQRKERNKRKKEANLVSVSWAPCGCHSCALSQLLVHAVLSPGWLVAHPTSWLVHTGSVAIPYSLVAPACCTLVWLPSCAPPSALSTQDTMQQVKQQVTQHTTELFPHRMQCKQCDFGHCDITAWNSQALPCTCSAVCLKICQKISANHSHGIPYS